MSSLSKLTLASLLLALLVLFERFLSIEAAGQLIRVSFSYAPYILAGWLLGPVWAALMGVAGDLIGMLLVRNAAFFPGFTLNALLIGLIHGLFLHNRRFFWRGDAAAPPPLIRTWAPLALSLVCVHLIVHMGLTTLWLSMIFHRHFLSILPARAIAALIKAPLEFASMALLFRVLEKPAILWLNTRDEEYE